MRTEESWRCQLFGHCWHHRLVLMTTSSAKGMANLASWHNWYQFGISHIHIFIRENPLHAGSHKDQTMSIYIINQYTLHLFNRYRINWLSQVIGCILMSIYIINQFTFHILDQWAEPNDWWHCNVHLYHWSIHPSHIGSVVWAKRLVAL